MKILRYVQDDKLGMNHWGEENSRQFCPWNCLLYTYLRNQAYRTNTYSASLLWGTEISEYRARLVSWGDYRDGKLYSQRNCELLLNCRRTFRSRGRIPKSFYRFSFRRFREKANSITSGFCRTTTWPLLLIVHQVFDFSIFLFTRFRIFRYVD